MDILRDDEGLSQAMAKRIYSQVRKGAALHTEWVDAFRSKRFLQVQGRAASKTRRDKAQATPGDLVGPSEFIKLNPPLQPSKTVNALADNWTLPSSFGHVSFGDLSKETHFETMSAAELVFNVESHAWFAEYDALPDSYLVDLACALEPV